MKVHFILLFTIVVLKVSCFPFERLQKYRSPNGPPPGSNSSVIQSKETQASVQIIDKDVFKFPVNSSDVWDAALDVLVRSYNVNLTSRDSGIMTTEWDTFYLGQDVFRNKISLRFRNLSSSETLVIVRNNVETIPKTTFNPYQSVWLPSQDRTEEVRKFVGNLASRLDLSLPTEEGMNVTPQ